MSTLAHKFNKVASKSTSRDVDDTNYPPPFSIRFTFEERARLDDERGSKTLAAHINLVFSLDAVEAVLRARMAATPPAPRLGL